MYPQPNIVPYLKAERQLPVQYSDADARNQNVCALSRHSGGFTPSDTDSLIGHVPVFMDIDRQDPKQEGMGSNFDLWNQASLGSPLRV